MDNEVKFREFDDVDATREGIESGVLGAIQNKFADLSNDRYQIKLDNVRYDDPAKKFSLEDQKAALMRSASLSKRVRGTWKLIDKTTGDTVDERDDIVAHVPYMTQRGTFVYNGSEYTVANQMRLRAGVYTRKKQNGQYEAHFNVLPGTGRAFRIHMDPETGVFKTQVGQAHLPLYPVLKAMGVTDDQLKKAWGNELLTANRAEDNDKVLTKMYKRLVPYGKSENPAEQIGEIQATFARMRMEPDIVQRSLGRYLQEEQT
jgi:DNA-directed RNA polymerase beta subunit